VATTSDASFSERPFRFGLQIADASSARELTEKAQRAEALGFDTIFIADHIVGGLLSPFSTLAVIAGETTRVRVGTLVLNNDLRHPALVAREAATLDLLSDGRFELGLGAGHAAPEYRELGLAFDRPGVRVERLGEAATIIRRLFEGEAVTFSGRHYELDAHRLYPMHTPPLLVGGNGDRVLQYAARVGDIVGFTGLGRTLPDGHRHEREWEPEQVDAKVALVRAAAGARLDALEFNVLVQYVEITADRDAAAARLAAQFGGEAAPLLNAPYLLLGTVAEIVDQLQRARERWGFSYFVTRDAEQTAPVIAAVRAGR
jgi:probable F420-dependent oxidoreductase